MAVAVSLIGAYLELSGYFVLLELPIGSFTSSSPSMSRAGVTSVWRAEIRQAQSGWISFAAAAERPTRPISGQTVSECGPIGHFGGVTAREDNYHER